MFKIFFDTLARPRHIIDHVDEKPAIKFIGFLILTAIILVLPSITLNLGSFHFPDDEQKLVINEIRKADDIEYKIENNQLIYTGTNTQSNQTLKFENYAFLVTLTSINIPTTTYVVFSESGENYLKNIDNENAVIVLLTKNMVKIISHYKQPDKSGMTTLVATSSKEDRIIKEFKYDTYNVNFNKSEENKTVFENNIYFFCDYLYDQLKTKYLILSTSTLIIMIVRNLLISIATTLLITGLFFRFMGVPFGKMLKIVFLCYTPYVLGSALAVCFGVDFLAILGEVIALFYTYRTMKTYSLLLLLKKGVETR